jgi:hypothetical protein
MGFFGFPVTKVWKKIKFDPTQNKAGNFEPKLPMKY